MCVCTGWSKISYTILAPFILLISCVIRNENPQFKTIDFKVVWYIKVNLIDREIGTQVTKKDLHQMFSLMSILWFNDVQFPWSWSTTIPLTAILKWFGLLKSDYKSVHLKLCASSIIRILFLHYACHICWRFSFQLLFLRPSVSTSSSWKTTPLDDVINDIKTSMSSSTFHGLETYVISLSNDIWHLMIAFFLHSN